MARLGPLLLLFGLLARCGGGPTLHAGPARIMPMHSHGIPTRHVALHPGESRMFRPGMLLPGGAVTCNVPGGKLMVRVPYRPPGAWSVGKGIATPAGKKLTLQVRSTPSGSVIASCGRNS